MISSFLSTNRLLSFESSLFYFRFGLFSLAFWYVLNESSFFLKYFSIAFLLVYIFVLIDAYTQFFTGINLLGFKHDPAAGSRISGVFYDKYVLGSFLSRTLPIIFALMFTQKINVNYKITISVLLFIMTDVLIYITGERSAFFYLILSTLTIILLINSWQKIRLISFLVSMIIIVIVSLSYENTRKRMIDKTLDQIYYSENKITIFSVARNSFK